MPRLLATVVLPSIGLALVTTSTRGRVPFSPEKRSDARSERKDSATGPGLRCHDMSSTLSAARLPSPLEAVTETAGVLPLDGVAFAGAWVRDNVRGFPRELRLFER